MAITAAALQTALGDTSMNQPRVLQGGATVGTFQEWYIAGGTVYPGHTQFVRTTAADTAATQALSVIAALKAGPV